jgi:hypothetical protein
MLMPLTLLTGLWQLRPGVHVSHRATTSKPVAHAELARHHELQKKSGGSGFVSGSKTSKK